MHVVIPDTGVSLDQSSITLIKGESQKLIATVLPAEATDKSVTWSSSKTTVATVDADGTVTAKGGGEAVITVTTKYRNTAQCTVKVVIPVESVQLNKSTHTLAVGDSFTLEATILPGEASNKTVTWDAGGSDKVTLQPSGTRCTVKAESAGEVTVTVTTADGGLTASCTFTIKDDNTEGYGSGEGQWD